MNCTALRIDNQSYIVIEMEPSLKSL